MPVKGFSESTSCLTPTVKVTFVPAGGELAASAASGAPDRAAATSTAARAAKTRRGVREPGRDIGSNLLPICGFPGRIRTRPPHSSCRNHGACLLVCHALAESRISKDSRSVSVPLVQPSLPAPPVAPRRPSTRTLHGDEVVDDYAWMRQTDDPQLLEHLAAENAWTEQQTAHLADLRARVYDELSRILPEDDESAPWRQGAWVYRVRRRTGQQLPVHTRRHVDGGADAAGVGVLDENALAAAAGSQFVDLGACEVSPDGRLLAYSVDLDGSEVFTLRVRDLTIGEDLADELTGTYYGLGWAADSSGFLYSTLDDAYRPDTVRHHVLGTSQDDDPVVWHEPDRRFELEIDPTRSGEWVRLTAFSRDTSEVRLVPTADLGRAAAVVHPREPGLEYVVDHQRGPDGARLLVVVDDEGPQFRVAVAPVTTPGREHWQELVPHRPEVRVMAA